MEMYQIITTVLSSLSILGVGTVITTLWKENHNKHLKQREIRDEEHVQAIKAKSEEEYKRVLQEELRPMKASIESIQNQMSDIKSTLDENTEGTVTLLRDRMQTSFEFYKRKGYVTEDELFNWNQIFERYSKLGGNFFHERVGIWKKEIEALPIKEKEDEPLLLENKNND